MREQAVARGAMPMDSIRWDDRDVAGMKFTRGLAFHLNETAAYRREKDLPKAMAMPYRPGAGHKGNQRRIETRGRLGCHQTVKKDLSGEVLRCGVAPPPRNWASRPVQSVSR
jgi:hypothetical protein